MSDFFYMIAKNKYERELRKQRYQMFLEEKKSRLNKLLKKKYIMACDYCDFGTSKSKKIPVAEQLNRKKDD